MVQRIDVVVAGPGPQHPQGLETGNAVRQRRPDRVFEQCVLDVEVETLRVLVGRQGHAAQITRTFGTEIHTARVDHQGARSQLRR